MYIWRLSRSGFKLKVSHFIFRVYMLQQRLTNRPVLPCGSSPPPGREVSACCSPAQGGRMAGRQSQICPAVVLLLACRYEGCFSFFFFKQVHLTPPPVAMNYKENWDWMLQSPTGMLSNVINEKWEPDYGGHGGVGGLFCSAIYVSGEMIKWSRWIHGQMNRNHEKERKILFK